MVIEEISRESRCINGTLDDNYTTLRAENERLHVRLTEQADEFGRQIQSLHFDVAARDGEIVRLREVLQKISVWGCSGHCVDLCGSKCPCCMAEEALGGGE